MKPTSPASGYTVTEIIIALMITTLVIAAATSGWIYTVRGEKINTTQSFLDMDVRKTMENLKWDLRLSAVDKMYFYPPGPGPYTAISFPIAAADTNDMVPLVQPGNSNILWTSTVIYHVWRGSPNELRKTIFTPRNNALTPAECQSQLGSVVTNGNGSANASTYAIFKNLFDWSIWGKTSTYDAYAAVNERENVSFGSTLLGPGTHTVTFTVIGKNASSTGYKIGLDTLTASACGVEREGESQIPPAAQSGATAASEYMLQGSWSGNYQLGFPAASTGAFFTINVDNDRWVETNFRGQGALCTRTVVGFDPTISPKDYVVQLEGSPGYPWGSPTDPYAWTAANQTVTPYSTSDDANPLSNCVVRVLLRGASLVENAGAIRFPGLFPYVFFQSSTSGPLTVSAAYIAESSSLSNYSMNAKSAGTQLYLYGNSGTPSCTIPANNNSYYFAPAAPFAIDKDKSYFVTYLISGTNDNAAAWQETNVNAPGSYVLPASAYPNAADAAAADWSMKPVYVSPYLLGISALYTTYPTNGLFTSQIFDTKIDTPVYSNVSWNAINPYNQTSVKVKVRTAVNPDMSDAPAWSNITAFVSSPTAITCGNKRYVQFQAILNPNSNGWSSPELKDVTITWAGATKVVDIAAVMTKGPNYGICSVTVDGNPLAKGIRVDLKIYQDITGWNVASNRITSSMTTEMEPRNTGR